MTTRVPLPMPTPRHETAGKSPLGVSAGLMDRFGRRATDLRISLTDKCNLRCTYCMPAEGLPWLHRSQMLTAEEVRRVVRIGVEVLGVTELRLTGGEPLVRKDLDTIISGIRQDHPQLPIALTTNAVGLDRRAQQLKDAGLTRINVSLDSVHRETFAQLTRRDNLDKVLAGVRAAAAVGLTPLKINAVLMRGINDHQAPDLLSWALENGYELRFIEQMPLEADGTWSREDTVTAGETRALLEEKFSLGPADERRGSAPAERYNVWAKTESLDSEPPHSAPSDSDLLGTVGIIASVTEPFCSACTRTRITAEGRVMSCLFSSDERDLLSLLRDETATDTDVAEAWAAAMWDKPAAHGTDRPGFDLPSFSRIDRPMSAIGG